MLADEAWGIDFEGEVAVVTGDVPMGIDAVAALARGEELVVGGAEAAEVAGQAGPRVGSVSGVDAGVVQVVAEAVDEVVLGPGSGVVVAVVVEGQGVQLQQAGLGDGGGVEVVGPLELPVDLGVGEFERLAQLAAGDGEVPGGAEVVSGFCRDLGLGEQVVAAGVVVLQGRGWRVVRGDQAGMVVGDVEAVQVGRWEGVGVFGFVGLGERVEDDRDPPQQFAGVEGMTGVGGVGEQVGQGPAAGGGAGYGRGESGPVPVVAELLVVLGADEVPQLWRPLRLAGRVGVG